MSEEPAPNRARWWQGRRRGGGHTKWIALSLSTLLLGCTLGDLPTESDAKDAPFLRADKAFYRALDLGAGQSLENRIELMRQIYLDGTSTLVENYVRHRLDDGDVRVGLQVLLEYIDNQRPFYDELRNYFESQDPEPGVRKAIETVASLAARSAEAQVIFFVGAHRVNAFVDADRIGIALEWFLPEGSQVNFRLNSSIRDAVQRAGGFGRMPIWAAHEFTHILVELPARTVLEVVINEGIAVQASRLAIPGRPLHEYLGYDAAGLDWARANEAQIWRDLLKVRDSQDPQVIRAYISDDARLYPEGPGRIGYFIGYRVAESYLGAYAGLRSLVRETSAESILDHSGYVP